MVLNVVSKSKNRLQLGDIFKNLYYEKDVWGRIALRLRFNKNDAVPGYFSLSRIIF
jgi:hypothetical protein